MDEVATAANSGDNLWTVAALSIGDPSSRRDAKLAPLDRKDLPFGLLVPPPCSLRAPEGIHPPPIKPNDDIWIADATTSLYSIGVVAAPAKAADLGELDSIKGLPGFSRAAAQTLSKAWLANLDLAQVTARAAPMARSRLAAISRLEAEALRHLPASMRRPGDLFTAALSRLCHARALFGRISVNGRTEMSPVWRPLLAALSEVTEVRWIAGPRHVPSWVRDAGIPVVEAPASAPEIQCESCASPRHEALEAMRWARSLLTAGVARPEEIAVAAASPEQ